MRSPAIGLDFGTTNSSIALASERGTELIRFAGGTPSFRSLLYLEQHQAAGRTSTEAFTGPAAISRYLGRHMAQVERPGRLIQSLKSYLAVRNLNGTEVFARRYTLEDLISRILRDLRAVASEALQTDITHAVVGRPVHFVSAETDSDDAFAVDRLTGALRAAGFTQIEFLPEPIAAAYTYEATLDHDELVLIGDFGGGTSDFTLIRVGPTARYLPREERILGTSGVGLAGDALDARLVRHLVAPALGSTATITSFGKPLPAVPAWIYANLERWHYHSFLRSRNVEQILATARLRAASQPVTQHQIDALITLVDEDLGYALHQAVQATKVALSFNESADFTFRDSGVNLRAVVSRAEFEQWISPELAAIRHAIDVLLRETSILPAAVDRIFLTGGTSFVPSVRRIFEDRFSIDRVVIGEAFTSVAQGLALFAHNRVDQTS
jgi:hypothetical chaperone protein